MSSINERNLKFLKYINKNEIKKLKKFLLKNIEYLHDEFSDEFECHLFYSKFSTSLLYYLFSHDEYDFASLILSNEFNVYKGYDSCLMMKILNIKEENIKYLKLLVKYKFDINHKCHKDLSTMLHMACIAVNYNAVKYLLEEGALAFLYKNDLNSFNSVNMHSFIFGVDDSITPLCLVTELRTDTSVGIASMLLNSIPDIKLIKSENSIDSTGYNTDIDNLLCVALREDKIEIISLLYEMNFDFKSFKNRVYSKCKNNEYKYFVKFESLPTVRKLKSFCRLKIRSHLGDLENWCLHRPIICFENECNLIPSPRRFLRNLNSLNLPNTLISYLNYNQLTKKIE